MTFEEEVMNRLIHIELNIDTFQEQVSDMKDEYETILERLTDNWGDTKCCKECHGTGQVEIRQ